MGVINRYRIPGLIVFALVCTGVTFFPDLPAAGIMNPVTAAVSPPDIIGVQISLPANFTAGSDVIITDYLRNAGSTESSACAISYSLVPAGADIMDPETRIFVGKTDIGRLNPNAQRKVTITLSIPGSTEPGSYYLVREIDPDGQMAGEIRTNNLQRSKDTIMVTTGSSVPDGITGRITTVSGSLQAGGTVALSTSVMNENEEDSESFTVYYYLSDTKSLSDQAVLIGSSEVDSVSGGETGEITGSFILPDSLQPGEWYLFTSFVPAVGITSEDHAGWYWYDDEPIRITRVSPEPVAAGTPVSPEPDIVSLETTIPDYVYLDESFTIPDSVANVGGTTASIVRVEYLLSTESDGSDGRHIGWWTLMNLDAGETRSSRETLGIPSSVRPGLYYLVRKITVTSNPPEKNTGNNVWISNTPFIIRYSPSASVPDLTHIRTIFPCGNPGDTVQITDTISNIGNTCAEGFSVAYYVSPYDTFDPATATYLGVWTPDRICPGEQKTQTTGVTIPGSLKNGSYYWYSVIDPCGYLPDCYDYLPELDKTNNLNAGTLYIGPCVFCGC